MAFPGTYNINYYKGDTYEFNVYPKTTAGDSFSLSGFTSAKFTISSGRGNLSLSSESYSAILGLNTKVVTLTAGTTGNLKVGQKLYKVSGNGEFYSETIITLITSDTSFLVQDNHATAGTVVFKSNSSYTAYAEFAPDGQAVSCAITPEVASYLDANIPYVYDIQIFKDKSPYPLTYTLLTGTISLTEDITLAPKVTPAVTAVPAAPTNFAVTGTTSTTISVSWDALTSNPSEVAAYYLGYIKNPTQEPFEAQMSHIVPILTPLAPTASSYQFTGLDHATPYAVGIIAQNIVGPSSYAVAVTMTGV
jgi:hypothetical protein